MNQHPPRKEWIQDVTALGIAGVAHVVGLEERPQGSKMWGPCPACGEELREKTGNRGPIGTADGVRWKCHRCEAFGKPLDLIAYKHLGKIPGSKEWGPVRKVCEEYGLIGSSSSSASPPPARPIVPPATKKRELPDLGSVRFCWEKQCVPVTQDEAVSAWVREKTGADPGRVEQLDLMRALKTKIRPMKWMKRLVTGAKDQKKDFKFWNDHPAQWRAICPMFDATGVMRTLHARALTPTDSGEKAASPTGCKLSGHVLANELGRKLLADEAVPDGRTAEEYVLDAPAEVLGQSFGVLIVEGVPDLLYAATSFDPMFEPAILGVISGAWTSDFANRIPSGARVAIAVDPDDQGDSYAMNVAKDLRGRCDLIRWESKSREALWGS